MYNLVISSKCKKDLKLAKKQGRDMDRFFSVVDMLVNKQVLPEEFKDHALIGDYANCRECHINPDWLLIYRIYEEEVVLYLARVGSHSDLFG